MQRHLLRLVVLGLATAGASKAYAQTAPSTDATRGYWIGASLGVGTTRSLTDEHSFHGDGALAGSVDLDMQRGPWLTSARLHSLGLGIGDDVHAYSLLFGRATTANSFGFSAISLGATALSYRPCAAGCGLFGDVGHQLGASRQGVGVMLATDVALRVGRPTGAGIGLTGYVDANTVHSFAGLGLELTFGHWR